MTSGFRLARAVYSAAVYPAGPLPMMITFSTSAISAFRSRFTLYSTAGPPFVTPLFHSCPQTEERDHSGHERQPEGQGAEHQDGHDGEARIDPEGRERADHPALHAAHAAGDRKQVAEHADEEGLDQHGERRRVAEGLERGPQDSDLEGPEERRAEQGGVPALEVVDRVADAGARGRGERGQALRDPAEQPGAAGEAVEPARQVG